MNEPTPIQAKAIPVILQGNDLIGNAPSGSGKTGAFLLPSLARLLDGPQKLRGLVLTPTREHAAQVENHARDFSRFTELRVALAHNAAPVVVQERLLRDPDVDILIATVDRLLELHARKAIVFDDVEILVLDEADRMVDMGLAGEIRKLLKLLPETRQTLLFSATMPAELNRLAKEALIEPVRVDLTQPQTGPGITHAIYPVPKHLKIELLDRLLSRSGEVRSTIVFTRQREGADRLAPAGAPQVRGGHAARAQEPDRSRARHGRPEAWSAADRRHAGPDRARHRTRRCLARGELRCSADSRRLRAPHGRAGRPDAHGDAFTLMAPEEQRHLAAIERFVGRAIPRVLLPDFDYNLKPNQLKQVAIYDDERVREKRADMRNAGFLNKPAPSPPSSGHRTRLTQLAAAKPRIAPISVVAKLKPKSITVKVGPAKVPAKPILKPLPKPIAKPVYKPLVKPLPKPVVKPGPKLFVRPLVKPLVKPFSKMVAKKPAAKPASKPKR